jgi:hypothetical protein
MGWERTLYRKVIEMANKKEQFEIWFSTYFCYTQCEDSPYSFKDLKSAFGAGWKLAKEHISVKP